MAPSELPPEPAPAGLAPVSPPPAPDESAPPAHVEDESALAPMPAPPTPPANGAEEMSLPRSEDHAPAPPAPIVSAPLAPLADPLEPRIRRIEEALERLLELRTAETRITAHPVATPAPPPPAVPAATAVFFDVGKRLLSAAAGAATPPPATPTGSMGILWLLRDTWAEARVIVRMYVDPRYNLPLASRLLPIVLLAAILLSKYWVPGSSIPFLGDWLLVKLVDLVLAFLLFKWLGHEARRYRQTSPDLPPSLRL